MLINQTEKGAGLNFLNYPKFFIEYSNDIEEYNPTKNKKCQLYFMIWLLIGLVIKKLNPVLTKKIKYFPFLLHNLILLFQKR